jgi:hypothetical protein
VITLYDDLQQTNFKYALCCWQALVVDILCWAEELIVEL